MIGKARFDKLLEPYHIGRVKTRNRIVKPAAQMCYYNQKEDDDSISEVTIAFYEALAKGGAGIINVESPAIDYPLGMTAPRRFRIDDDKYIQGYSELTEAIHNHGSVTFLQLYHAGPWHKPSFFNLQPVAASAVTRNDVPEWTVPRELTIPNIQALVDEFARAAKRAKLAGFDGVELNAAGSHLFATFLSRFWNKRQDGYGCGSLESRARFVVEIIQEIKKRVGQDFPVSVLMNGIEYEADDGLTAEEGRGLAQILEKAGADAIQVRVHHFGNRGTFCTEQLFYPEPPKPWPKELDGSHRGAGALLPLAAAMKKAVSIPIIAVGRLDPVLGEEALRQGKADFIAMSRRLLADHELPNKIASGRLEDIAPCMACLRCVDQLVFDEPVRCQVNAALGREQEYKIKPAEQKKRVLVVGGGPAGMETARAAALRGHEVMLYERERKLGGLLALAALVKGIEIEDLPALVRYLKTQITKLGVKIALGKEVDLTVVDEIKPDVVILATGGIPTVPEIPGINRRNVASVPDLHRRLKTYLRFLGPRFLRWLTRFWMPLGKRVVIIGGTIVGCELAEFLVKRGKKVTILDTAEKLGEGLVEDTRTRLFKWLAKKGVPMMTEVEYEEVTDRGLAIITKEGKRLTIEADTIVPAMPLEPNTRLLKALEGKVPEVYAIGDCRAPRLIIDAIADGHRVAHDI